MTAPGGFIDPGPLRTHLETLSVVLARWAYRDDTRAQPDVRRAANTAVETIDVLLRELHRIRGELVDQIRVSDDAAQARVDRLLRERYRDGCVVSAPIGHPPWCRVDACGVARTPAGTQIGTHVGPAVVIGAGGRLVVKLELRQIDGGEAHILVAVTRDGRRVVSVGLDLEEAELAGGALLDMVQLARP